MEIISKETRRGHKTIFGILLVTGLSKAMQHGGGRRTKNLQGEREKWKRREERKRKEEKEKREEKKERKGEKGKRCIRPMNCQKGLHELSKVYKIHKKRGRAEKSRKRGRRDKKRLEKTW